MREGCKSSGASEARGSGGAEKFQLGSAGTDETMKPTDGARVAVIKGEGVIAGLRKLEEETTFGKYARPAEEKGGGRWGWLG
jgi:hypothetical protein